MGLFDKLFGKKTEENTSQVVNKTAVKNTNVGDKFVSIGDNVGYKIIRDLNEKQIEQIEKSTILIRTGQFFMHYWTDNLICEDREDYEWQNKVLFFWKMEEQFPQKSLPPIFQTFKVKYFGFKVQTPLKSAQVMPWYGMPGQGQKFFCEINGVKVTVPELFQLGKVYYFEFIELTDNNLDILTDTENYFFIINEQFTPFYNGNFHLNGKPISVNLAYRIGGIHIIRMTNWEREKL